MNAKKCKALRRLAFGSTVGWPVRGLISNRRWLINDPKTSRGLYRMMKKAAAR